MAEFLMQVMPEATQERYEGALKLFQEWASARDVDLTTCDPDNMDLAAADYILDLYEEPDAGITKAYYIIAALKRRWPGLRMPACGKVIAAWRSQSPPVQALALPREAVHAFFTLAWASRQHDLALCVLTCFCGLLRIGEALKLTVEQVLFDSHDGRTVVLMLGDTKRGVDERVVLRSPLLVSAFRSLFKGRSSTDKAFKLSYFAVRRDFVRFFSVLGMPALGLRTHGLRRGGATELVNQGIPLPNVLEFGRWHSESSAKEYIRRGQACVVRIKAAADAQRWKHVETLARSAHVVVHASNLMATQLASQGIVGRVGARS